MKKWFWRLRGVLGIGVVWSTVGAGLGVIAGIIGMLQGHFSVAEIFEVAVLGGCLLGFFFGIGFAGLLVALEGRRTFEELSASRAAVVGGLMGAAIPIVLEVLGGRPDLSSVSEAAGPAAIYGLLTAIFSGGTLLVAQRARAGVIVGDGKADQFVGSRGLIGDVQPGALEEEP